MGGVSFCFFGTEICVAENKNVETIVSIRTKFIEEGSTAHPWQSGEPLPPSDDKGAEWEEVYLGNLPK